MDLAPDTRARRRNVAVGVVAIGLLLLVGIVALTAVDRTGKAPLEGVDPVVAIRAARTKIDGKRFHGEVTVGTAGALQLTVAQKGTFDLGAHRVDIAVTGVGAGPLRVVTDATALYVQGPKPFDGKPWGRLSSTDGGPVSQVSGSQLTSLLTILGGVRTASDKGVEHVGTVPVRHLASYVSGGDLKTVSPLFAQMGVSGGAPLDVLIDGSGVPRQIDVTAEAGATKVHLGIAISDIGKPAAVSLPPASEVTDIGPNDLSSIIGR